VKPRLKTQNLARLKQKANIENAKLQPPKTQSRVCLNFLAYLKF